MHCCHRLNKPCDGADGGGFAGWVSQEVQSLFHKIQINMVRHWLKCGPKQYGRRLLEVTTTCTPSALTTLLPLQSQAGTGWQQDDPVLTTIIMEISGYRAARMRGSLCPESNAAGRDGSPWPNPLIYLFLRSPMRGNCYFIHGKKIDIA